MAGLIGELKHRIFGPETVFFCKITNPCPQCQNEDCNAEMYLDSDKQPEKLVVKCPACGPIKELFAGRYLHPEPRFQRNYAEWLTGEPRRPPKKLKEI